MIICAVDDEPLQLRLLTLAITEAQPQAELHGFACGGELLADLEQGLLPDVAFLDIELPDVGGLELARLVKERAPRANIIFVTGFSQYAQEAYALRPSGYVMKPASKEKILLELQNLRTPIEVSHKDLLRVRCFGNFEVFANQEPVKFQYSKTKELFAYLIDRQGSICTSGALMSVLWGDDACDKKNSYLRNLCSDLLKTFAALGAEGVVMKRRGALYVVPERLSCDFYDWTKGMSYAVNAYGGEYMSQFSWAEMTLGAIEQHQESK